MEELSLMKEQPSYQSESYWQNYQDYFPEHLRINHQNQPKEEWWLWQGINVHLDRYVPSTKDDVKVIMLHGGGGYARLLSPLALDLYEKGYEVVMPDFPGYGLTDSPERKVDYLTWADLVVDLIEHESEQGQQKIVLYGLSLGGMLAYYAAARSKYVKGIIATTLCDPRLASVRAAFAKFPRMSAAILPLLKCLNPILGTLKLPLKWFSKMHALSNNAEFNQLVVNDPNGGGNRTPLHFMLSIMIATPKVEPENFNSCSVLLAHPAEDKWTPFELSEQFYQRLACNKKVVLLENAGHMPIEQQGLDQLSREASKFLEEVKGCRPNTKL
ncbi:hypothetical protein A3715_09540 [Oleiphilus sp. HI0009]|nr:hypothetical protein A3715_09540 [Oleiphilus sp. HI0009]KZY66430.1 hypothetical protein A3738_06525 [Oleiphilus sp. HI0066]KZY73864.1 hypothetical protein A3739_15060 [Oleiphilus sp. HI0067]